METLKIPSEFPWRRNRIAVLEVYGPITSGARVAQQVRIIHALREDQRVKGVVVDVDSPGGSAALSDHLHHAIKSLAGRKPVIAHVRNLGLSGGYLVACAAQKIVALPTAMVGSIGVIISRPIIKDAMQRLGVQMYVSRMGEHKDMMQPWREPTVVEERKLDSLRDEFYQWFIDSVAQSRGLDASKVREMATGELFTAAKGVEMGLVDQLGDMDTALDMMTEIARVPRNVTYARPRRPLLERALSPIGAAVANRLVTEIESRLQVRAEYRT
ncbi:MAG TPA: signal peptide peptidase SppA [Dehalococcoidia bacterium]|nr:signal peptide peptidase SppA [Dehalococcoidia bacterium]